MAEAAAQGNNPWAWTGLLKWSLNHMDGTRDTSDFTPMSAEDKAFLEKVMSEGIVDEAERMKFILTEATNAMEYYKSVVADGESNAGEPPISEGALEDLLQELRDIVEQIDYARAFCSLQGLLFLLGCIQQDEVPVSLRQACLGILSTLGQNNPPVQEQLLELGAIKTLSDLFFEPKTSNATRTKIMQSMSSMVRNHELAENVFTELPQSPDLFLLGLDPTTASQALRSRTLFFLRALVTSDLTTFIRLRTFETPILLVVDTYLVESNDLELREMAIALLEKLMMDKKGGVRILLQRKNELACLGVQRIASLRQLTGDESEATQNELESWENVMVLLARAEPEEEEANEKEQTLLLENK